MPGSSGCGTAGWGCGPGPSPSARFGRRLGAVAAQDYLDKCRKILAAPGWCSSAECDGETSARQQRLPTKGHVGAWPERSGGIWREHGAIRRVIEPEHLAPEALVEATDFLYPDLRRPCALRG